MLDWLKLIKGFYSDNLWNKAQVWDAVSKTKLTQEQYKEITGDIYPVERPVITQ